MKPAGRQGRQAASIENFALSTEDHYQQKSGDSLFNFTASKQYAPESIKNDSQVCFSKSSLLAPQMGQVQSSGRSSNEVPAGIPPSSSPTAGSYT
jgi:hypothetical protein